MKLKDLEKFLSEKLNGLASADVKEKIIEKSHDFIQEKIWVMDLAFYIEEMFKIINVEVSWAKVNDYIMWLIEIRDIWQKGTKEVVEKLINSVEVLYDKRLK